MTTDQAKAKAKISLLSTQIRNHDVAYHQQDAPMISDGDYDEMMRHLRALEATFPEFAQKDSPTQTVGAPIKDQAFGKIAKRCERR